jgi:8-oxo-dGTP diphosphatase
MKKSHTGVYGLIEKNGRILLVKKSRGPYKSMWDLPGGRPCHGESIFETLSREIFEETGVRIFKTLPHRNEAFLVEYKDSEKLVSLHHICLIYNVLEFDDSGLKEDIVEEDVAGCAWMDKSKLDQLSLSKVALCI